MSAISLKDGIFPFWIPYVFAGMPFFADLQIAVLYPFNLLQVFFVEGHRLSPLVIQFTIIFHFLICSVSSFYVGKHFKLSNLSSVLFSILFTYSSYMIIHIIHMALIEAVAWLPLTFLLCLKFIDKEKYIYIWSAGIIMALCTLCGYPQVTFFNYFFISLYILLILIKKIRVKEYNSAKNLVLGFVIFLIVSLGLSAIQLLPSSEFVAMSNRAFVDYNFAKQGSLQPLDLVTFFVPKVFGVWNWNETSTDLKWWTKHQEGAWAFSFANVYISALVVVMLIPSLIFIFRKKVNKLLINYLIGISVFCILFAFGGFFFFHKLLFDTLPVFNRFRNPSHVLYLFTFSVSLIIAFGIDGAIKDKINFIKVFSKKYFIAFLAVFLLGFVLVMSGFFNSTEMSHSEQIISWVKKQYNTFFVLIIVFSTLFYLFLNEKIKLKSFTIFVILILCVDVYINWFDHNNGTRNPEKAYNQYPQIEEKLKEELKTEYFRVNMREGSAMLFQRNQGEIDRIPFIEGYNALILQRYVPYNKPDSGSTQTHDIMNIKYKLNPKTMQLYLNQGYLPRIKMFYDIKVCEKDEDLKKYMESREFDYRKTLALEKQPQNINLPVVKDSLNIPKDNVKITDYNLNNIVVDADNQENGFLFFSEIYYPAWKAFIDGKETEIYRTDYCMRSIYLEKGKHKVELKYQSETFAQGLKITLSSLLLFIVSVVFLSFKSFKKKRNTENINK
jgi:hypothetical protein